MKTLLNIIAFSKSLFTSKMVSRRYDCWGYKRGRFVSLYEITLDENNNPDITRIKQQSK